MDTKKLSSASPPVSATPVISNVIGRNGLRDVTSRMLGNEDYFGSQAVCLNEPTMVSPASSPSAEQLVFFRGDEESPADLARREIFDVGVITPLLPLLPELPSSQGWSRPPPAAYAESSSIEESVPLSLEGEDPDSLSWVPSLQTPSFAFSELECVTPRPLRLRRSYTISPLPDPFRTQERRDLRSFNEAIDALLALSEIEHRENSSSMSFLDGQIKVLCSYVVPRVDAFVNAYYSRSPFFVYLVLGCLFALYWYVSAFVLTSLFTLAVTAPVGMYLYPSAFGLSLLSFLSRFVSEAGLSDIGRALSSPRVDVACPDGFLDSLYVFNVVVFAPIWEEAFKRFVPFGYLLPFFEYYSYLGGGVPSAVRMGPLLMHVVAMSLPFEAGLLLHASWNLGCTVCLDPDNYFTSFLYWLQPYVGLNLPFSAPLLFMDNDASFVLEPQWYMGSLADVLFVKRRVAEVVAQNRQETPSHPVWDRLRYKGKLTNPGLSRGRLPPSTPPPSRGGMPHRHEAPQIYHTSRANCFPTFPEPAVRIFFSEVKALPSYSPRRTKVPRRSFGGHGERGESVFSSGKAPSLKKAIHVTRTLLSSRDRKALKATSEVPPSAGVHTRLLEEVLRDRRLRGPFLAKVDALDHDFGEPLIPEADDGTRASLIKGWGMKMIEAIADHGISFAFNEVRGEAGRTYDDEEVVPWRDTPSPYNLLFNQFKEQAERISGKDFPVPYPLFLAIVALLQADTGPRIAVALELLIIQVREAPYLHQSERVNLVALMGMASVAMSLGLGVNSKETFNPEGWSEWAEWSDFFGKITASPLAVKVVAMLAAFAPIFIRLEGSWLGTSLIASLSEWSASVKDLVGSPLVALISFMGFLSERLAKFQETGKWIDLFGQSPAVEWLDKAKSLTQEVEEARRRPSLAKPRDIIERGKALVRSSTKFRESLVSSQARALDELITSFEGSLSNSRTPPLGFFFIGPPGTGKTTMVDLLHELFKKRKGVDPSITLLYPWSLDKYQAPNSLVSIIHLNDAFQTKDEKAAVPQMQLFQSFVDSFTLLASGAGVSEKNVQLHPDFVIASTNAKSFTFSSSVSGADKFDRRYRCVDFQYTSECVRMAAASGMTNAKFFAAHAHEPGFPPLVEYTVGWMVTPEGNKLDFTISQVEYKTSSVANLLGHILHLEANRPAPVDARNYFGSSRLCACGLPLEVERCGCDSSTKRAQSSSFATEDDIEAEGASLDAWMWEMGLFALFVSVVYTIVVRWPGELWVRHRHLMPLLPTVFTHRVEHSVKFSNPLTYIQKNTALLLVGLVTARYFLGRLRTLTEEGTIQSTPSYPPPPPEEVIRRNQSTQASWLGAGDNSYVAEMSHSSGRGTSMHGVLVSPQLVALPKHFFTLRGSYQVQEGDPIRVTYRGTVHVVKFQASYLVADELEDLAFLFCPSLSSAVGSVFSKLPRYDESPQGELCSLGPYQGLRVDGSLRYQADTKPGDCGFPLLGESGVIYGFHIGRYSVSQVRKASPLSQDRVREALNVLKSRRISVDLYDDVLPEAFLKMVAEGRISPGLHPRSDAAWYARTVRSTEACDHYPLGHSSHFNKPGFSAHPTTLHDEFSRDCKAYGKPHAGHAVKLPDGTYQSATTIRLDACDHSGTHVPHDSATKAIEAMLYELAIEPGLALTPLCDYTVLCGSPLNVLINGKDVTKSVGRTLQELGIRKEDVFKDLGDGNYGVHEAYLTRVEEVERHLRSDEPLRMCFVAAVAKDEVYPADKAALGRKRFFFLSDAFDNHVMRKYLLPLIDYLLSKPFCSKIVGTINAGSPQWKELYAYLTRFSDSVTDGDQSSMDTRHKELMVYYAQFMKRLAVELGYTADDARVVERICLRSARYLLEVEGLFFVVFSGLTSGRSDTIICNSVCLILIFYISYFELHPGGRVKAPGDVITLAVTGDDSVMNSADEILSWYHGEAIRSEALKMGYVMTAGDKSPVVGLKPISGVSYLKRGFRVEGDYVWAPLSKDSIFKSLAYSTGKLDGGGQVLRDRTASQSAIREAFLHGRNFFEELKLRLERVLPDESFPTFDELKFDYDNNLFDTWRVLARGRAPYVPLAGELEVEGMDVESYRIENAGGVVYPRGYGASLKCPTPRRGALRDFPVLTNLWKSKGSNLILTYSFTELNSKNEVHLAGPTTPTIVDPAAVETTTVTISTPADSVVRPLETADNFFSIPRKIGQYNVGAMGDFFPLMRYQGIANVDRRMKQWTSWRGDIRLSFRYTGSSSLLGMTRYYASPTGRNHPNTSYSVSLDLEEATADYILTSCLPHVDLDFSCCCQQELVLPFMAARSMLPYVTAAPVDVWVLREMLVNPAQTASGITPPEVSVEIWMSIENLEMDILRPEGEVGAGILSDGLGYGAALARRAASYVSTLSLVLSYGALAASKLGLSRPTVPAKEVVMSKSRSNLNYMSGEPDFSTVLGSSPYMGRDVSHITDPSYVSSVSQMASTWCQGMANAQPVVAINVRPGWYYGSSSAFRPDVLGFLGMMHEAWIGDIDVKFQVLSSPLVRTRIGINIYPHGAAQKNYFVGDGSVLAHTFDVVGSVDFEFTVPYLSMASFKRTGLGSPLSDGGGSWVRFFFLEVPLGPSATPVYPMVNIWSRAGKDFTFLYPSLALAEGYLESEGLAGDAIARVGEDCDNLKLLASRKTPFLRTNQMTISLPADGWCPGQQGGLFPVSSWWTFDTFIRRAFWGYTGGTKYTAFVTASLPGYIQAKQAIPFAIMSPTPTYGRGEVLYDPGTERSVDVVVPDRSGAVMKYVEVQYPPSNLALCECLVFGPVVGTYEGTDSLLLYQAAGEDRTYVFFKGPPRFLFSG